MLFKKIALSAAIVAGFAVAPLAGANAQAYGPPPCSPFPLTWPFCVAGAAVYTAGAIVTAPFRALTPPPPAAYYPPPAPAAYAAPAPGPNWRWRRWCRNHPYKCHY